MYQGVAPKAPKEIQLVSVISNALPLRKLAL